METAKNDLVRTLAEAVIGTVAPGELDTFASDAEDYFDDPERALRAGDPDEALGMGVETVAHDIVPVVLFVAGIVVEYVIERALQETEGVVRRRWLRRRARIALPVSPLAEVQLVEAHAIAVGEACRLGLRPQVAREVADAFVAQLRSRIGSGGPELQQV